MKFTFNHQNLNITDIDKSVAFYQKALGLREVRRKHGSDGSFTLVFMSDEKGAFSLELTWLKDHPQAYDLGENEFHLAFTTEDMPAAHGLHQQMGCICFENKAMGIYFIADPDNYWIEIVPEKE